MAIGRYPVPTPTLEDLAKQFDKDLADIQLTEGQKKAQASHSAKPKPRGEVNAHNVLYCLGAGS